MSLRPGHVVCCVDRCDATPHLVAEAERLRAPGRGRLTLVHVAPPLEVLRGGLAGWEIDGEDLLAPPRRWLESVGAGIPGAETLLLCSDRPAAAVAGWARDAGADLIIASAHQGRLARTLLGSFTRSMIDLAPCDAVIVRPVDGAGAGAGAGASESAARLAEVRHVACCVDGARGTRLAVEATARLTGSADVRVSVVHAVAPPRGLPRRLIARLLPMPSARRRPARRRLRRHAERLGQADQVLLAGHPGQVVCDWAQRARVDLLVLGPRTRSRPGLGGFASHVVSHAPCAVLLARRREGDSARPGA